MNTAKPLLRTLSKNFARSFAVFLALLSVTSAQAQSTNAWWKPSALGGSGTWNSANAFWSTNSDGSGTLASPTSLGTNIIYNFSGTAGTVNESSSFTLAGINWLTTGYTWTSGANRTLTGTDQTTNGSGAGIGTNTIYITNNANLNLTGTGFTFDALSMTGGAGATLTLSNAAAATTTINWGTSIARSGRTNFVNTIIAGGGTVVYGLAGGGGFTQSGNITNNSTGMLVLSNGGNNNGSLAVAGTISGSGNVTLVNAGSSTNSPGRIALNASNDYSGDTTLNALAFLQSFSTNSTNGTVTTNVVNSGLNNIRIADSAAFGTGTITSAGAGTNIVRATVADLNLPNAVTLASGSTLRLGATNADYKLTLSGAISGQGALVADSGATVILASNNTYSGTTTVSSGTLQVGNGSTAGTLGSGNLINDDKLVFDRSDSFSVSNNISGTGSLTKTNASGTLTLFGLNSYSGPTAIGAGTLVINGTNTGSGTVTLSSSSSVLRLGNTNALANGTLLGASSRTNIGLVDLSVGGDHSISAYGTSSTAGFNMNFTNSSGSPANLTFTAATNFITLSSSTSGGRVLANLSPNLTLSFNGAVDIGSSTTDEVTFDGPGNTVINGRIFNDNTGGRGVTKTGTGTLFLNASNSYNGVTAVDQGVLVVNGSLPTNSVTVSSNATLGGLGRIQGNITVNSNGILRPGSAATNGLLTALGALTVDSGGSVNLTIDNLADYGRISNSAPVINGTINVAASGSYVPSTGNTFQLFSGAIGGTPTLNVTPLSNPNFVWVTNDFTSTGQISVSNTAPVLTPYQSWLTNYSLTGTNAAGTNDPDGDGFINSLEFAFNGNPTTGTPALLVVSNVGGMANFSFMATTNGVSYQPQSTTNLATGPWTNSPVAVTNAADQTGITPPLAGYVRKSFVTNASGNVFYRVVATITNQ